MGCGIKRLFIVFIFLSLVIICPGVSFAELKGESRSIVGGYSIDGYTPSSFYPQGAFYRQELDLSYNKDLKEDLKLDSFLSVRYTDDTYVDPDVFSVESIKVKLTGDDFGIKLGDIYAKFSTYALSQSLKGVDAYKDIGDGDLALVFGVTKSRWEDLWKELDSENYTRYVSGISYAHTVNEDMKLRIDFVNTDDDDDSSASSTSTNPIENRIIAINAVLDIFEELLKCTIDTAHSWHDANTLSSSVKEKDDYAVKVNAVSVWNDIKFYNKYERIGSRFNSPVAAVSADREEYNTKLKMKLLDGAFKPEIGYTVLQNNIDNSETTTTFTNVPYIKVLYKPIRSMKHLQLDVSYKERMIETTDGSTTDESTETGYVGVKNRIGKVDVDLGYQHRRKIDDIDAANERDINKLTGGMKTRLKFGKLSLRPNIRYDIEKDKKISTKGSDTYQNMRIGLIADWPDSHLELRYNLSDTDMDVGDLDKVKTVTKFDFRHYLWGDRAKIFNFSYEQRDYEKEDDTRSYTEDLYEAKYTSKF